MSVDLLDPVLETVRAPPPELLLIELSIRRVSRVGTSTLGLLWVHPRGLLPREDPAAARDLGALVESQRWGPEQRTGPVDLVEEAVAVLEKHGWRLRDWRLGASVLHGPDRTATLEKVVRR